MPDAPVIRRPPARTGGGLGAVLAVAAAPAALARPLETLPGFRTPSRGVSCLLVPFGTGQGRFSCAVAAAAYAARLQARCRGPVGGGLDWHGFELTPARRGAITCSGGIPSNPATEHPRYGTLA